MLDGVGLLEFRIALKPGLIWIFGYQNRLQIGVGRVKMGQCLH